jgi:hypothetical protein
MGLASPDEVSTALHRIGDADLVLVNDPLGTRPVHVLLATRVGASTEKVRQVIADPASYRKSMPSFVRIDAVGKHARDPGVTDLQVAWELEVPLWNLEGKLWLRPQPDGVVLELTEGDFAPGWFRIATWKDRSGKSGKPEQSIMAVEGFANVREANMATRQLTQRSPLAEPGITVAAAYVMLKALAYFAERGKYHRPSATIVAPEPSSLDGEKLGKAGQAFPGARRVLAAVRNRENGRLLRVDAAMRVSSSPEKVTGRSLRPASFIALPGWKKITPGIDKPDECKDTKTLCWTVETNLPLFSLGGTWKIWPRPWRARMVAGDGKGAVMGIDILKAKAPLSAMVVLSQHPRMDQAGYVARKLIAAEPLLEQGLALALSMVEVVSLAPALEKD